MSHSRLAIKLRDPGRAGVCRLPPYEAREVAEAAKANGFACFLVDLGEVRNKDSLLDAVAQSIGFPDWFGENWDAFEDCLTDLSWRPAEGYVLVLCNCDALSAASRQTLDTALNILSDVAVYWREAGVAFWSFVDVKATHDKLPGLP